MFFIVTEQMFITKLFTGNQFAFKQFEIQIIKLKFRRFCFLVRLIVCRPVDDIPIRFRFFRSTDFIMQLNWACQRKHLLSEAYFESCLFSVIIDFFLTF